ncbi:hypothetical protein EON65_18225 [archaeon]|nr:MAG: hypothetical protein EON65_18225 [archaeon]
MVLQAFSNFFHTPNPIIRFVTGSYSSSLRRREVNACVTVIASKVHLSKSFIIPLLSKMATSARRDNHDLLFSGRSNGSQSSRAIGAPIMQSARREQPDLQANMHEQYGLSEEGSDPLQLEHVLGYSGTYRKTLYTVANDDETFIKRFIEKINNIHESI